MCGDWILIKLHSSGRHSSLAIMIFLSVNLFLLVWFILVMLLFCVCVSKWSGNWSPTFFIFSDSCNLYVLNYLYQSCICHKKICYCLGVLITFCFFLVVVCTCDMIIVNEDLIWMCWLVNWMLFYCFDI